MGRKARVYMVMCWDIYCSLPSLEATATVEHPKLSFFPLYGVGDRTRAHQPYMLSWWFGRKGP